MAPTVNNLYAVNVRDVFKWFVSKTPYLVYDTTKAPHITGSGIFPVMMCLESDIRLLLIPRSNDYRWR